MQEIYFPAFRRAVQDAGVGSVMSSYNPLNGVHTSENYDLAVRTLREAWGFEGIFMSDWNATYSDVGAANGGLDLEMPSGKFMNRETC
ncbi:MAG: glycoside hydrolase family 3 N-terminal domain-containing protein [Alistipes shahii]